MVLRYGSFTNELFFLEATSQGIYVQSYSNIKDHIGTFYQKLVVRHLEFERTDEQLRKMIQLIDEARECRYNVPLMQALGVNRITEDP